MLDVSFARKGEAMSSSILRMLVEEKREKAFQSSYQRRVQFGTRLNRASLGEQLVQRRRRGPLQVSERGGRDANCVRAGRRIGGPDIAGHPNETAIKGAAPMPILNRDSAEIR